MRHLARVVRVWVREEAGWGAAPVSLLLAEKLFPAVAKSLGRERWEIAAQRPLRSRVYGDFPNPTPARQQELPPSSQPRSQRIQAWVAHGPCPETEHVPLGQQRRRPQRGLRSEE